VLSEVVHARHLALLGVLKQMIDEAELPTTILERSETIPLHMLMAGFQEDSKGRDRFLQFSFLPLNEEDMQAVQLLQIYSTLPFTLPEENRGAVASLLLEVNTRLPIGHFGVNEQNEVHYRYVYSLSASKMLDADEILDIISLFIYMSDMFGEAVEKVASGESDVAAAVSSLSGR
jgi:hypothetical protein